MQGAPFFMQIQPKFKGEYPSVKSREPFLPESFYFIAQHSPATSISLLHYHSEIEIGICLSGSGIFIIDEKTHFFTKGDISVIGPSEVHLAQSNPDDISIWNFISIPTEGVLPEVLKESVDDFAKKIKGRILPGAKYSYIQNIIKMICYEDREKPPHCDTVVASLLAALLPAIVQIPLQGQSNPDKMKYFLDEILPAIKYIAQNYQEQITVEKLTDCCHCSETQLRRLFSTVFNTSPIKYIHQVRINKAMELLADPRLTITEISLNVGYDTISSFNRNFKEVVSVSPSDYRKNLNIVQ